MNRLTLALTTIGLLGALGCGKTPSPAELCKRLDKLEAKDSKKWKKKSAAVRQKERKQCIKDMTALKKKSPKAYKSVVGCSKQDSYDEAMLCIVAYAMTHTSDKEDKEHKKISQKGKADMDAHCAKGTDWSERSLHGVTDSVDGVGFTLQLPKGVKREAEQAKGPRAGYVFWSLPGPCSPNFMVRVDDMAPKTLQAIASFDNDQKILKKKAVPGGFLVVTGEKGKQFLEIKVYRKTKSGKVLKLNLAQRSNHLPKVFEKQQAWQEKIALSFQVK